MTAGLRYWFEENIAKTICLVCGHESPFVSSRPLLETEAVIPHNRSRPTSFVRQASEIVDAQSEFRFSSQIKSQHQIVGHRFACVSSIVRRISTFDEQNVTKYRMAASTRTTVNKGKGKASKFLLVDTHGVMPGDSVETGGGSSGVPGSGAVNAGNCESTRNVVLGSERTADVHNTRGHQPARVAVKEKRYAAEEAGGDRLGYAAAKSKKPPGSSNHAMQVSTLMSLIA